MISTKAEIALGLDLQIRIRAWRALDVTIRSSRLSDHKLSTRQIDAETQTRLRIALRRERALGRAGHWAYDMNRHIALKQALSAAEPMDQRLVRKIISTVSASASVDGGEIGKKYRRIKNKNRRKNYNILKL